MALSDKQNHELYEAAKLVPREELIGYLTETKARTVDATRRVAQLTGEMEYAELTLRITTARVGLLELALWSQDLANGVDGAQPNG